MKRIDVFYGRVSTNADSQDSSIIHQEQYFKERGISKGYIDRSGGTSINKRIAFQELLKDCGLDIKKVRSGNRYKTVVVETNKPSKVRYIYTKAINRFARNTSECLDIVRLLKNKGTYVIFEDLHKSTEDESFMLTLSILSSMAENESLEKSRSIKMGNMQSAKNGIVRSYCAYGYEYHKDTKELKAIPQEAEAIKFIFNLKLQGYGGKRISKELNEAGYKTRNGGQWLPHVINRMIKNPIYAGYTTRNRYNTDKLFGNNSHVLKDEKEWILIDNGKIEPIITKDMFDKVQKIRKKQTNIGSKVGVYKGVSEFASKIICDKCGEYYTRNKDIKVRDYGTYERVFYNCSTKKRFGVTKCNSRNVSQEEIDDLLKIYIGEVKYKKVCDNFYKVFLKKSNKYINSLIQSLDKDNDVEIKSNTKLIEENKQKLAKLLDLYIDGTLTKDILDNKKNSLENEINSLEKRNKKLSESNEQIMDKITRIKQLQEQMDIFTNGVSTYINRNDFIENYLVSIVVKDDGRLSPITQIHHLVLTLDKVMKGYVEE